MFRVYITDIISEDFRGIRRGNEGKDTVTMDAAALNGMIQTRINETASPTAARILTGGSSFSDCLASAASETDTQYQTPALASAYAADASLLGESDDSFGANALRLMLLSGLSANGSADTALLSVLLGMSGAGLSGLLNTVGVSGLQSVFSGISSSETGRGVVAQALTRLGDPYSKTLRGKGQYVDCSYLAQWAYGQMGIDIPGTAAAQAQYCRENGYEISKDELQPGDLIFWTQHSADEGRWNNIHHVAIYMGDDKIVEARKSKNCVQISNMWGKEGSGGDWEIAMYARPR